MEELKEKLARFVGFELIPDLPLYYEEIVGDGEGRVLVGMKQIGYWGKDGVAFRLLPDFPHSLDACFKWLVPKLPSDLGISIGKDGDRPYFYCRIEGAYFDSIRLVKTAETPALALCKAVEKLIDG